jgi:hypothetical protein
VAEFDSGQIADLNKALEGMEVDTSIRQRIAEDPSSIRLDEVGLDSKDLLLLDFHLEEIAGKNIKFDAIRDDMTVMELITEFVEVGE